MSRHRLLTAALPLAGLVFSTSHALAGQWPVFDLIRLTPVGVAPEISVELENGTSWTKVRKSDFVLMGRIEVKMKTGRVAWFWVKHTGKEIGQSATGLTKSFKKVVQFPTSTGNIGLGAITAVSACNARLGAGGDIGKDQFVKINTDLELSAAAETLSEKRTRDAVGIFPLRVRCVGVATNAEPPGPPVADTDDLKQPEEKFKVRTAALGIHKPKSKACPTKARINARFETNFAGKVTFIYRQAGGGKSAPITVMSAKKPNGKFYAVHNQVVDIKKAIDTKYMVEVVGKGVISDWQALKVPCKIGLGGNGDLANPSPVPFKVLSAQLGIKGPKTKVCPNKAVLTAWFKTNKPGKVGFRLMRKDGPAGPMIFATAVKAPSGYVATYTRTIAITKPINTSYSAIVPGSGGLASNFVPLRASCSLGQPGAILGE